MPNLVQCSDGQSPRPTSPWPDDANTVRGNGSTTRCIGWMQHHRLVPWFGLLAADRQIRRRRRRSLSPLLAFDVHPSCWTLTHSHWTPARGTFSLHAGTPQVHSGTYHAIRSNPRRSAFAPWKPAVCVCMCVWLNPPPESLTRSRRLVCRLSSPSCLLLLRIHDPG